MSSRDAVTTATLIEPPRRPVVIAAVLGFSVLVGLLLAWIAGLASGVVAAVMIIAVLLAGASVFALLLFKGFDAAISSARYVIEDQAYALEQRSQAASRATPAERQALDNARAESSRLGEQLSEARGALDSVRRQLESAVARSEAERASGASASTHDVLTGLRYGAAAFEARVGELIEDARHSGAFHGVMLVGLDELDQVLDQVAPAVGDEYIWTVARQLADLGSSREDAFRISAKHFALVVPAISDKKLATLAQKLVDSVAAREFSWGSRSYTGSVSVGVLTIGLSDASASDIVERAVHCHGQAHSAGGNRVHVESMLPMLERRNRDRSLRDWLEDRLAHEHQRLAAQAIVPIDGQPAQAVWHELLLRIEDDDGVWLPPEHYVDVLERLQLTAKIDRWVMQNALKRAPVGLQSAQRKLSLNVFGSSLGRESFLAELRDVLASAQWPTAQLCFEIDEATVLARPSRVSAFIETVAEFGCEVAIDRYRGVAGLSALRTFPVQYIKLHESLFARRSTDLVDRAHLEWLIQSAHLCSAKVVAVGVRDEEALARVRELKVDFVQGYVLAPPAPWAG